MKTNSVETPSDFTEQFYQGVPGIVHDHMHWENGVLVEDTPATNTVETNSVTG